MTRCDATWGEIIRTINKHRQANYPESTRFSELKPEELVFAYGCIKGWDPKAPPASGPDAGDHHH